jgi:hypothetical protein
MGIFTRVSILSDQIQAGAKFARLLKAAPTINKLSYQKLKKTGDTSAGFLLGKLRDFRDHQKGLLIPFFPTSAFRHLSSAV